MGSLLTAGQHPTVPTGVPTLSLNREISLRVLISNIVLKTLDPLYLLVNFRINTSASLSFFSPFYETPFL